MILISNSTKAELEINNQMVELEVKTLFINLKLSEDNSSSKN